MWNRFRPLMEQVLPFSSDRNVLEVARLRREAIGGRV
jgi:hypothetical protein